MKKIAILGSLIMMLCFIGGCQNEIEQVITEEGVEALFVKDLQIWNEGNLNVVDEIIAPEYIIFSDPHDPYENRTLDHETYKKRVRDFRAAFPDIRFAIEDTLAVKDKVVTRWIVSGTDKAREKNFVVTGMTIYLVADGRLKGHWQNWDWLGFYKQRGFILSSPEIPDKRKEK